MDNEFLLRVSGLSKSFPGVQALEDVRLDIRAGRAHALVGENGAGKSTLMRILAGLERPDRGQMLFRGREVQIRDPHEALRMGISMIHQELLPFPELTVAENLFMGREPASRFLGWIDQRRMHAQTKALLAQLGANIAPRQRMKNLSVAEMQTVEIAKALARNAEIIIMDEPTSSISDREVEALFGIIRDLKRRGVAVIYVSHKLDEIFRIADTVSVLRDGRHVATHQIGDLDERKLIALMVGRELASLFSKAAAGPGDEILAVRGLSKAGKFWDVTFTLRRGEILGLAGLMGAGRTDIVSALFGLTRPEAGEIRIRGRQVRLASPADALRHGVAMVSEDRKQFGLVLPMSVQHNLTLSSLQRCSWGWLLDRRRESQLAEEQIRTFSIKTRGRDEKVGLLSGGNQQKVVLAKALLTDPSILILDEPTRGIDIHAKAEVYGFMARLAREGKAILLVSSELSEILSLSDRVLVVRQGRIAAELDPRRTTQEEVMRHAMPN